MLDLSSASHRIIERGPIELVDHVVNEAYENTFIKMAQDEDRKNRKFKVNLKMSMRLLINNLSIYNNYWDQAMYLLFEPKYFRNNYDQLILKSEKLSYICGNKDIDVG